MDVVDVEDERGTGAVPRPPSERQPDREDQSKDDRSEVTSTWRFTMTKAAQACRYHDVGNLVPFEPGECIAEQVLWSSSCPGPLLAAPTLAMYRR